MTLSLHNLKPAKGSVKRRKVVGRGNASGHGTFSTRGSKGQRARTGGRNGLKYLGMKAMIMSIPKKRGFRSLSSSFVSLNISELEQHFSDHDLVTLRTLIKKGLVDKSVKKIKILGNGTLTKNLQVKADAFSENAKNLIEKAGGTVTLVTQA